MNYKYNLINLNNLISKDINDIKDYLRYCITVYLEEVN